MQRKLGYGLQEYNTFQKFSVLFWNWVVWIYSPWTIMYPWKNMQEKDSLRNEFSVHLSNYLGGTHGVGRVKKKHISNTMLVISHTGRNKIYMRIWNDAKNSNASRVNLRLASDQSLPKLHNLFALLFLEKFVAEFIIDVIIFIFYDLHRIDISLE